jgi:hypothetical protein
MTKIKTPVFPGRTMPSHAKPTRRFGQKSSRPSYGATGLDEEPAGGGRLMGALKRLWSQQNAIPVARLPVGLENPPSGCYQ